ncbi:MAG: hypothetical protein WAN10_14565 [Candidatus Acidiferrales bacterium]
MKNKKHKHHKASRTDQSKPERPAIVVAPGKLRRAIKEAERVLRGHCERLRIFQRGGELVRAYRLKKHHGDKYLSRPKGSLLLAPLNSTALTDVFNKVAVWKKRTGDEGRVIDCPDKIAKTYLSRLKWKVPVLVGIISAPILLEDGTVLSRPGYDKKSDLLFDSDEDWPTVPERPTRAEAKAALENLLAPFGQFPFVSDEDRAVFVACILTAIQRRVLGACPLFGFTAPTPGTGKSLLTKIVAIIATGKPAAASGLSRDKEEMRKMIMSVLCEGVPVINLDNVDHPLFSPDLAKAITEPEFRDRVLGRNKILDLSTNVLWMATGNNLTFRGDLPRRVVRCSLNARVESPESRTFKISNLEEYVRTHRKELFVAGLTILRAYQVAGCPRQNVEAYGGFDDWSKRIREPLVWVGIADPCKTRAGIIADDPEREESAAALQALYKEFGENRFMAKDVLKRCCESHSHSTLTTAMLAATHQKEVNSQGVGDFLRHVKDRIFGGLCLEQRGKSSGVARWQVRKADSGHSGDSGQFPTGVTRFPRLREKES